MTLKDEGFRFVCRDGVWSWTHPAELRPADFDATDMSDEEFSKIAIDMHKRLGYSISTD